MNISLREYISIFEFPERGKFKKVHIMYKGIRGKEVSFLINL